MIDGLNSMFAGLALYLPEGVRNRLRPVAGERGQAFVEYVLLLAVITISVFAVATWTGLGGKITTAVGNVGNLITNP
jgi:Flp pilus assembly pilin Flp